MRTRAWQLYLVIGSVGALAYFFLPGVAGEGLVFNALGLSAAAAVLVGARWHRPGRSVAWCLFAASQVLFVIGDLLYYTFDFPFPSLGDVFYLGTYPLLIAGLLILVRGRSPGGDGAALTDALIISTGMGLLGWLFLIVPYFRDASLGELERVASIAYPIMDVLVLAVFARLAVGGGRRGTAFWLFGLSIACLLVTDVIYGLSQLTGGYDLGGHLDAGWIAYYLLLGAAALHPSMRALSEPSPQHGRRLTVRRLAVLACASLVAPAVEAFVSVRDSSPDGVLVALASAALFLLVLARTGGLLRNLRTAVERKERAVTQETTLRRAAAGLVAAVDRQAIAAVVEEAARALLADLEGTGVRASLAPPEFSGALPGAALESLRMFAPVTLGGDEASAVAAAFALTDGAEVVTLVPVRVQGTLGGLVAAASSAPLTGPVLEALGSLAAQAALAADAAALSEDLQRRRSEERLGALVLNSSDVIAVLAPDLTVRYVTPSVLRVLGHEPAAVAGGTPARLWHSDDVGKGMAFLIEAAGRPGVGPPAEWRVARPDGSLVDVEVVANNLFDDDNVRGMVLTLRDVSERKAFESQLTHQAFHDALTGLANRPLFTDRAQHALTVGHRSGGAVAVLFCDLDEFKTVNDSLGHAAGDDLLRIVAGRLQACIRPGDTAARLGGDEFAVLLEDVDAGGAQEVADRIIAALQVPTALAGRELPVHASIGIALSAACDLTADELLRNADVAMYAAKAEGKGRHATFRASMHTALLDRLEMRADLQHALTSGGLRLHYQPIVELATGRVAGLEALARWEHPRHGLMNPDDFIPLAEETGLILPLGRWVLEQACASTRRWQQDHAGFAGLTVNVNLSAVQLQQPGFAREVKAVLDRTGLDPRDLTLEITETVLMENMAGSVGQLAEVRRLGVRVAIDDFGTGYSSFSYLRQLPVDTLKIAKEFVDGLSRRTEDEVLSRAMVEVAANLGLDTVAEGIEMAEQADLLRAMGCLYGQGYRFSRPLVPDDVDALLSLGPFASLPQSAPAARSAAAA